VLQACGDGLLATHPIHRQSHADDVIRAIYLIPSIVLGDLLRRPVGRFLSWVFRW
jgi:hypothetical protein